MRDRNHYGRERLFAYLLSTDDTAVWVVGLRRIGKTSLLRQIEHLTAAPESSLIPLFWDMQGCGSSGDLSYELFTAIEDESERFAQYEIDVEALEGMDAVQILRRIARSLAAQGKTLLLLIDEAEVLIGIARSEPGWLARLRKILQEGHLRTILASTKLLVELNQLSADWNTSPFLFGFSMVNLWSLDPESAAALVQQKQSEQPIEVDPVVLEDILVQTNRHPYLLQYLCHRLCVESKDGRVTLRPLEEEDLEPDHMLAGLFMIDFQHLTPLERRILLSVARHTVIGETDLLRQFADEPPDRVRTFLWGLDKLGHVRQVFGQYTIGNEYLRRWLSHEWQNLNSMHDAALDDNSFEEVLQIGHQQELETFASEVMQLEDSYGRLLNGQAPIDQAPDLVVQDLNRLQHYLDAARRDFHRSQASFGRGSKRDSANDRRRSFHSRLRRDV